ncbi:MAG: universal stress protein [Methyloligellaceae bacterium]
MYKTILVPIDLAHSQTREATIAIARNLAAANDGKLVLLNVIEAIPSFAAAQIPAEIHQKVRTDAVDALNAFASEHGLAETAEAVVREGHAPREILEHANQIKADLIVVASHDPGPADYLLGSVAGRVVRHAHCSVLVTRNLDA